MEIFDKNDPLQLPKKFVVALAMIGIALLLVIAFPHLKEWIFM